MFEGVSTKLIQSGLASAPHNAHVLSYVQRCILSVADVAGLQVQLVLQ